MHLPLYRRVSLGIALAGLALVPAAAQAAPGAMLPAGHPIVTFQHRVEAQAERLAHIDLLPLQGVRVSATLPEGYPAGMAARIVATANYADHTITYYDNGAASALAQIYWLGRARHVSFRRAQPELNGYIISAGRTGPRTMTGDQEGTLHSVIHESLHLQAEGGMAYARMTPAQRSVEEGTTDALAADLVAPIAWRLWRVRTTGVGVPYASCSALVRKWSARVTRTYDWHSPAARRARVALHRTPFALRDDLIRSVGLVPGCDVSD